MCVLHTGLSSKLIELKDTKLEKKSNSENVNLA